MTRFRPCIDLHEGKVKQIVGGTLGSSGGLKTNFVSEHSAAYFAERYRQDGLRGGHVIQLGPGNEAAARSALSAHPGGLQAGGGITSTNAASYLQAGASHVIVTSSLFDAQGHFQLAALTAISLAVGKKHLVVDLSCRARKNGWQVAMNRWQTLTDLALTASTLAELANYCDEFLVHAADVEGKCEGIDEALVRALSRWSPIPVTYAGGARRLSDLARVDELSDGKVDLTIGSALDIFGGTGLRYEDCVAWNRRNS